MSLNEVIMPFLPSVWVEVSKPDGSKRCAVGQTETASHLQSGLLNRFVDQVPYSMLLLYITSDQTAAWPDATYFDMALHFQRRLSPPPWQIGSQGVLTYMRCIHTFCNALQQLLPRATVEYISTLTFKSFSCWTCICTAQPAHFYMLPMIDLDRYLASKLEGVWPTPVKGFEWCLICAKSKDVAQFQLGAETRQKIRGLGLHLISSTIMLLEQVN